MHLVGLAIQGRQFVDRLTRAYQRKHTLVTELEWNNKLDDVGRDGKDEHNAVLIREEKRGEKTDP